MPRTAEDVETYLYALNRPFNREGSTFIVSSGAEGPAIAIRVNDPILVVRVDIGNVPEDQAKQNAVFRRLLTFNATDLVQAAYALEGEEIVLTAGMPLENLDENELAAVLSDIDLALARHIAELRDLAST
ncbi:MAG: hypothetical protein KC731_43330 [Myxococcales bacterium]|nr:hypothetical protein [Myxococcales bacterium]